MVTSSVKRLDSKIRISPVGLKDGDGFVFPFRSICLTFKRKILAERLNDVFHLNARIPITQDAFILAG
jgi:hypothetical protein